MLIGDTQRFAIEAAATERSPSGWALGSFRFWLGGRSVGNWDDAVDLRGCLNWLKDFSEHPRARFEPSFAGLSAVDIFALAHSAAMGPRPPDPASSGLPQDAFARFFIGHLGMSAFDGIDILLVKDGDGNERVIWREPDGVVRDVCLRPREMENIAMEFHGAFAPTLQ